MRTRAAGAAAAVLMVAVPAVFLLGGVGGGGTDRPAGSFPTETPTDASAPGATTADAGETPTGPAFAFSIDRIERCGRTCRDVTSTLENGGAPARNVTVYTRIHVGNGTDGDVVWRGRQRVGDLDAGESFTTTRRVSMSLADAVAIESAGGRITVQTTVDSAAKTVTFTQRRQVG